MLNKRNKHDEHFLGDDNDTHENDGNDKTG